MGTEEVVPRKEICGVGAGPGNFCGGAILVRSAWQERHTSVWGYHTSPAEPKNRARWLSRKTAAFQMESDEHWPLRTF